MLLRREFLMGLAIMPRVPNALVEPTEVLAAPVPAQVAGLPDVKFKLVDDRQNVLLERKLKMCVAGPGLLSNADEVVFGPVAKTCRVQASCEFVVAGKKHGGKSNEYCLHAGDTLKFPVDYVRVEFY